MTNTAQTHKTKKSDIDDSKTIVNEVDYKDKYLRALADYQNLLKRVEKERTDFVQYANERLIVRLLDVIDDFNRATESIHDSGIALVYKKLFGILQKEGIEKIIIAETDLFNPEYMECIEVEQDGSKIVEIRAGYTLKGKILRPAHVKIVHV